MITDKKKLSWAFYDWANSAFATTVIAGFYPIFYKQYWSPVQSVTESTYQLGMANAVASLIIVLFAPLLGAIADRSSSKKRFLLFFTLMGSLMTCSLYLVEQGAWLVAIVLYILANIGFMGGNVFYDALLVDITPDHERDRVSALGYAFGYLGGGLLFALNVAMTLYPASFGFANSAEAVRFSFVCVALWWGLFSIPLFFYVPERKNSQNSTGYAWRSIMVCHLALTPTA
ncbi:MAG: MFS transporter UMF1 family [Halothiobacillaceae bacterium]|nr:MAG: MFS transporter UMF1 family [Halothiobacillaceae bacterium]